MFFGGRHPGAENILNYWLVFYVIRMFWSSVCNLSTEDGDLKFVIAYCSKTRRGKHCLLQLLHVCLNSSGQHNENRYLLEGFLFLHCS